MTIQGRLIIGAPFGNWLNFPHAISTLGTFTAEYRGSFAYRLWRVARTVRYYPGIGAWKNRLGLPNPGVERGLTSKHFDKIISVLGRNDAEWRKVIDAAWRSHPLAIEMNVSCPNCGEHDETDYEYVFQYARHLQSLPGGPQFIVKLPPVNYRPMVERAFAAGIINFHCCNTMPTPNGGLSGKPLQPFSLEACRYVASNFGGGILIGGGGVTTEADVDRFMDAGCTNVSVASVLFFPWKWPFVKRVAAAFVEGK